MTSPISGIDHVVIAVNDLAGAAEVYRRLGFTLSPRGVHSPMLGTANHTIMLRHDYFELLGIVAPTEANLGWRTALAEGDGIVAAAVAIPDAAAAHAAWERAGLDPEPAISFSRPVDRPGGKTVEARFEVVNLPRTAVPAAALFACGHLTRDAVWLPELLDHPNTAVALRKVTIAAENVRQTADAWARALVGSEVTVDAGSARVAIGPHAVEIVDAGAAAARFGLNAAPARPKAVALEFAVADLGACAKHLAANGIEVRPGASSIAIAPEAACGVALTMVQVGAAPGSREN
jgi:catechol 2,3-dioxygenase-like lactoylglutathione lyase family enzyme